MDENTQIELKPINKKKTQSAEIDPFVISKVILSGIPEQRRFSAQIRYILRFYIDRYYPYNENSQENVQINYFNGKKQLGVNYKCKTFKIEEKYSDQIIENGRKRSRNFSEEIRYILDYYFKEHHFIDDKVVRSFTEELKEKDLIKSRARAERKRLKKEGEKNGE